MASTSVTTVGGVVIVTQVIPKDSSIPLQIPVNPAPQAPPPNTETPPPPSKEDSKSSTFLQEQPQGLGVVQIFIGLLCVVFSLTILLSPAMMFYTPFVLGAFFVVSGSLAVAAGKQTSVRLVWASLLSNLFSALLSLVGLIYICFLLTDPPANRICSFLVPDPSPYGSKCPGDMWGLNEVLYGLLGLFLVLVLLQVCVSITVCVFAGRLIRSYRRYSLMTVESNDSSTLLSAEAPEA